MPLSADEMRELFRATVVVRKPTWGIVKGYHELPYICLGRAGEGCGTTQVTGKVQVSPQFIIRPKHLSPSYEEIFGEDNVDLALVGRVFGFMGFPDKNVACSSEMLEVTELDDPVDRVLSQRLDQLDRAEDIGTGVIIAPDSRYYPVSVERFIASVLHDEFSL